MKKRIFIMVFLLNIFIFQNSVFAVTTNSTNIKIPVLMYHSISNITPNSDIEYRIKVNVFTEQIKYLYNNKFTPLTMDQYIQIIYQEATVPNKPILITFDDGYEDFYTNALPVLEKYKMKATMFIPSDWINKSGYLDENQLIKIKNKGFNIGSHGIEHERLTNYDSNTKNNIVVNSKLKLEKILGSKINTFSFPYGAVDEESMMALYSNDYIISFSSIDEISTEKSNKYCLPRLFISRNDTLTSFKSKLK